jgi:hypothetical protein
MSQKVRTLSVSDVLLGIFIGAIIIGPFIWTALGRELAKGAVQKGAKVTREQVERWIKEGEK